MCDPVVESAVPVPVDCKVAVAPPPACVTVLTVSFPVVAVPVTVATKALAEPSFIKVNTLVLSVPGADASFT